MDDNGLEIFRWHTFNVRSILPQDWASQLLSIAEHHAQQITLIPDSPTSREVSDVTEVPTATVDGIVLSREAPWLLDLYRGPFRDLGQTVVQETLSPAGDPKIAANLNVQTGIKMRYEAHVDTNPLQGMLYVTDHPPGDGGELVVAQDVHAVGTVGIDSNASVIYPTSGCLIFFDARRNPHYVRPLRRRGATRVAVAMNFYTPSCPESSRPPDLTTHLFRHM
ncbi:2OG-Fe(II) oxygenase [Pseudonocardia humida]|uniref:2OG-Fe(II) oxygenase n=1 Tax=Pseudonocardia humida TaxID=2800819 RepID=A0ABT1A7A6_9PSEU|nr:2OG-Fe(II) oxygenase [Pseudonocardia humida]MCO1658884.1 2OG-Fe(II) oxygenase [Pseudonocardia humida]